MKAFYHAIRNIASIILLTQCDSFAMLMRVEINHNQSMIESVKSFKVGDKMFSTFEEAQAEEMRQVLQGMFPSEQNSPADSILDQIATSLILHQGEVLAVFNATPNSMRSPKPARKPRRDKGVPRKKTVCEMDSPGVTVEGSGKYRDS